jgi:hypothetical protein
VCRSDKAGCVVTQRRLNLGWMGERVDQLTTPAGDLSARVNRGVKELLYVVKRRECLATQGVSRLLYLSLSMTGGEQERQP